MDKILKILLIATIITLTSAGSVLLADSHEEGIFSRFINDIQYTTRFKVEVDDNIFLEEEEEDSELKEIILQSFLYKISKGNHFFKTNYTGKYASYIEETSNILSHSSGLTYSYRPFDGFSIGFNNNFAWLQDSDITTAIGDRIIALGYMRDAPNLEIKYEVTPKSRISTNFGYSYLDVTDRDNDDYIDNRQLTAGAKLEYDFGDQADVVGFAGYGRRQIAFPQISEKSSVSDRPYIGLTKKFFGLMNWTNEVGFENIDMDDENNNSDNNIDYRTSVETTFSLYTKAALSLGYNSKKPSFRSDYTQYASDIASFNVNHAIDPKTSLLFDYTFERQSFESSDATFGQEDRDRKTYVHDVNLTLSRKLNTWLSVDCKYEYTKRDTDFEKEGYTNNKYSVALTAKY